MCLFILFQEKPSISRTSGYGSILLVLKALLFIEELRKMVLGIRISTTGNSIIRINLFLLQEGFKFIYIFLFITKS